MSVTVKSDAGGVSGVIQVNGSDKAVIGDSGIAPQIFPVSASVAGNALTLTLNPCCPTFRSSTLASGATSTRAVGAAISLTVPTSATLGTINATAARLALLAIDNAGTVELAVVNLAGGNNLDETTLISTTAISATATSASVIYSTTARSNVPFRVVGFIDITEATAGTWATAPSTVQGVGGQALAAMSSLGYGQTWQNVAGSRAVSTTYYNTTGRPIFVFIASVYGAATAYIQVNGVDVALVTGNATNPYSSATFIVPPGGSYILNTATSFTKWTELR